MKINKLHKGSLFVFANFLNVIVADINFDRWCQLTGLKAFLAINSARFGAG